MPTVLLLKTELEKRLSITDSTQLEELCFEYGLEYDEENYSVDGTAYYRVEVPSNRVDLLCVEGVARALNAYLGRRQFFQFRLTVQKQVFSQRIYVKPSVVPVRPYCFGAVLRGVTFTESNLKSFIDLQEKLHQNIARKRQLVAIGTHDLGTLQGPFVYEALPPDEIVFKPLNCSKTCNGHEVMELLSDHPQLKVYLPLIRSSPVYPVIKDARGTVLSLPPIINGDHSKVTLETQDVLIEVTATDVVKGQTVLNILASTFSEYCSDPFTIEAVHICYDAEHSILSGSEFVNPSLTEKTFDGNVDLICSIAGISRLAIEDISCLLAKMMIRVIPHDSTSFQAIVPVFRPDILHVCDLAEDVAVAYGYNNILASTCISGSERFETCLSNLVRTELSQCGYHETLTWGLCSIQDGYKAFGHDVPENVLDGEEYHPFGAPVILENPKSREFQMIRVSLIPGILKSLAANFAQELPLKLFELGNCVTRDSTTSSGSRTRRYCVALVAHHCGSGLELVHGVLDHILGCLGLTAVYNEYQISSAQHTKAQRCRAPQRIYHLVPFDDDDSDKAFMAGRQVRIIVNPEGVCIGRMGALHPSVLEEFGISLPCSVFEICLNPFLRWLSPYEL